MRKSLCTTLCCVLCLAAAGTALAKQKETGETVAIPHTRGTVHVPRSPSRIVVMDFGMLDTLDSLEAVGALQRNVKLAVPKTNLPSYLGKYKGDEYADVGGLKDFNLESIYAFKPELIIISGRQQDFYEELSSIAPVWQMNSLPREYLPGVMRNIRDMGKIFAAEEAVGKALADMEAAILAVRNAVSEKHFKTLVLLTNDGKISAYGSGSRFGIIYDALGFEQADPGIKVGIHGQLVNYEYLAEKNPDYIFVVDRSVAVTGKADGVRILNNELVNGTKAARNGHIVSLDPNVWYLSGGGLQSLRMMIEEIRLSVEQ